MRSQEKRSVGFSEHDVPDSDVGFGQTKPIEPTADERDLTAGEEHALDKLDAAMDVWDEALKGPTPKVVATPKPEKPVLVTTTP
jgi:hypothetical protein